MTRHDKKICDSQPYLPIGITLWQDTGFQEHDPEGVNLKMPTKRPKGKELSEEQKEIISIYFICLCKS